MAIDLRPAFLALLPLAAPSLAQVRAEKLNAPLDVAVTLGDVQDFRVTPDGQWVVYRAQQDSAEPGLYAVRADRSAGPFLLSAPGASVGDFELVPGALAVVFVSGADLYRVVPGGAAVRLNPPLVAGGAVQGFRIAPNAVRVAYLADQDTDEVVELHTARLAGAPNAVRVSPAPVAGGDVVSVRFSPDGSRVLFGGNLVDAARFELFSAPSDASAPAVTVSGALVAGGDVLADTAEVTPDGARALYIADALVDGRFELFSAPLDASAAPVRLNGNTGGANIVEFRVTGGGTAVYRLGTTRIFAVPADGSAPHTNLTGVVSPVHEFELDPAGAEVLFRASSSGSSQLWRAPIDGSTSPLQLSDLPSGRTITSFAFSPDSARALYVGAYASSNTWELFSVPIDGSAAPVRVHAPLPSGRSVSAFSSAPDGLTVVYLANAELAGADQLFAAPLDGSGPETPLHEALPFRGGSEDDFAIAGGTVVFRSDLGEGDVVELHAVPLGGGEVEVLNDPLVASPVPVDVSSLAVAPDGTRVAYTTDTGVFAVQLDEPGTALALDSAGPFSGVQFRQVQIGAGGRAVFVASSDGDHVFSVPLDGGAPAVQLSTGSFAPGFGHPSFQLSPDGTRAVFGRATYDGPGGTWVAPVDGSSAASAIGGPIVWSPTFTADGSRVLYLQGECCPPWDTPTPLYERDADAATPAIELAPLPAFSVADTRAFALTPDESRVLLVRDDDAALGKYELWSVERAGGAPPVKLSGVLDAGRSLSSGVLVTPDGTRAVYTADADVNDRYELYVVPVDGSLPPFEISGTMVAGGDVVGTGGSVSGAPFVALTPDSTRAVYVADALVDERFQLFSAPLDGSQPPIALATPGHADGDVRLLAGAVRLDPSGARVVFLADLEVDERYDLWSVPVAGGPVVKVNGDMPADRDVELGFVLLGNGRDVLFRADLEQDGKLELWQAPLDGRHRPFRRSVLAHDQADVEPDFVVGPAGRHVYYRADAEEDGRVELYRFPLSAPPIRPR